MKQHINEITEDAKRIFLSPSERVFTERVSRDHVLTKQYKGREIFELLQNVDDAFEEGQPSCEARIEVDNEWLTISNWGKPFTIDTLQRLCQGMVSSKDGEYIGCKGIGFRSVLNWSDEIEIYSGDEPNYISVRFSRKYANKQFDLIKDTPKIQEQVEDLRRKGVAPLFPILKAPEYIAPIEKYYDTVIRIHIRDEQTRVRIIDDLIKLDCNILLFLPHIQKITWQVTTGVDIQRRTISKLQEEASIIAILVNGKVQSRFYYMDWKCELEKEYDGSKWAKLGVALPVDGPDSLPHSLLYTFFPILNLKSPFPALLHATFCLMDNRNDLDMSNEEVVDANTSVFDLLLHLYIKAVITFSTGDERLKWLKPLKFPYSSFEGSLNRLNLEEAYLKMCSSHPILYGENDNYLCPNQPDLVLLKNCPEIFQGADFSSVCAVEEDNLYYDFAKKLKTFGPQSDNMSYLQKAIDSISATWNTHERIVVFKWWMHQLTIWGKTHVSQLPRLLRKQNGEFLTNAKEPCFLSSGQQYDVPDWAKISILHEEDENALFEVFQEEIKKKQESKREDKKRILPKLLPEEAINLQEMSSRAVLISPINSAVGTDYSRSVEFVLWLWNIWKNNRFDTSIKSNIVFKLPTKNFSTNDASKTFFGPHYHNELGAELFSCLTDYTELAEVEFEDQPSINEQKEFFSDLGVKSFPPLRHEDFFSDEQKVPYFREYLQNIIKKHPIYEIINYYHLYLLYVSGLDTLLKGTSSLNILKWVLSDTALKTACLTNSEPSRSYYYYKPRIQGQRYEVRGNEDWELPSFLRFVFAHTEWLEIEGKRVAPRDVVLANYDFLNHIGFPCISEKDMEQMSLELETDQTTLKQLLLALGVKNSYLDFPSDKFYALLLNISELTDGTLIEKSKRLSREIYRSVIENSRLSPSRKAFYGPSENKNQFYERGKVLAKRSSGMAVYHNVNEVFFSSSAVLNLNDNYFIDIPTRSGKKEDFRDIFNVRPFDYKYTIKDWKPSRYNEDFIADFEEFLPYIMTFRAGSFEEVRNLRVSLCRSVSLEYQGVIRDITENYSLWEISRSQWIIYVDDTVKGYADFAKEKLSNCLQSLFNVFFSSPSRDFLNKVALLFMSNHDQRKYFVMQEFGSDAELLMAKEEINRASIHVQKIKEKISSDFPNFSDLKLVEEIDWSYLRTAKEQGKLVELLKTLHQGKEYLSELSSLLPQKISIALYQKQCVEKIVEQHLPKFKAKVYASLCGDKNRWCNLRELWSGFDPLTEIQDVLEDFEVNLSERLLTEEKKYLQRHQLQVLDCSVNYDDVYKQNMVSLRSHFSKSENRFSDYINEFTNNKEQDSLLFFVGGLDDVIPMFEVFLNREETAKVSNIPTSDYLTEIYNQLILVGQVEKGKSPTVKTGTRPPIPHTVSGNKNQRKQNRQQLQGDVAEYFVVLKLAERAIPEVVDFLGEEYVIKWRSGAAKRFTRMPNDDFDYTIADTDDGLGYDIEVVNGNKKLLLEVKSSSDDECSFIMSANELDCAKKTEGSPTVRFRVVFVSRLDVHNPKNTPHLAYIDKSVTNGAFEATALEYHMVYKG